MIEEAARIIHQNYSESGWEDANYAERIWAMGTARAVFNNMEPTAYAIYGRATGRIRELVTADNFDLEEWPGYNIVPLYQHTERGTT